jgi:penicillin amidase
MSTPTLAPDAVHRSHKLFRAFIAFVLLVFVAVLGLSAWFYVSARLALPQLDGKVSLAGLSAPVNVTRDSHGVPSITAASLEDLFFAQGYVTAQDRLWQMDMTRRYASGRLSEILGSRLVKSDIRQRTLLMPIIAERAAEALDARDRSYLEAYARGVNAYIDSHRNRLPAEFHVLHYSPQPWTVVDSLLVGASMSEMLNLETLETGLTREAIIAKIGPELAADLYPNSSFRDHPPVPGPEQVEDNPIELPTEETGSTQRHRSRRHHAELQVPQLPPGAGIEPDPLVPGSNNWVVSGGHTASGKPLLSNDMHLPHQIPNTWYEVHLTSGDFDVAGVSLPGVPFVIVGHNRRVAWGFTNIGPAVTDFYVESTNSKGEYLTPDGWKQPEQHREKIHVRWGKDVDLDVAITRHGPIVTSLIPGEKRTIALKWVLFDPAASQVPFFDIDSAQNWDEFRRAFSHFGSPGQNVVYADVEGHIGYQATGFVPLRPWAAPPSSSQSVVAPADDAQPPADGAKAPEAYVGLPLQGTDNAHEWAGYIPYDKLPSAFDPPSGIIATANGRITPEGYPYVISTEWGSAYRTERIYRFLNAHQNLTAADMLALQTDVYSDFDRFCAQRFVYAVDHAPNALPRVREAAELMRHWDGRVATDSAAAAIVAASRRQLVRILLEPKLGDSYADYRWFMSSVWLENTMLMQPARWLPPNYSSFNEVFAAAVDKAVSGDHAPKKLNDWNWGQTYPVYLQHPIFGAVPILNRWTGPGLQPQSGNGYTVKQVGRSFGPSERMTVDLSNMGDSTLNVVTGESGNVFSPYFLDQWDAWYTGTTFPLPFCPSAVQSTGSHRLLLEPSR